MSYPELQKRAKELGIDSKGVKKAELEKLIAEAEVKVMPNEGEQPETSETPEETVTTETTDPDVSEKEEPEAEELPEEVEPVEDDKVSGEVDRSTEVNVALILNGAREVRKYSREMHGDEFAELAEKYATHRGLTVRLVRVEPNVTCPHCGWGFSI